MISSAPLARFVVLYSSPYHGVAWAARIFRSPTAPARKATRPFWKSARSFFQHTLGARTCGQQPDALRFTSRVSWHLSKRSRVG